MQKCKVPSFFWTNTMALHHVDWLGCIAPTSSMSLSEACTSSRSSGGMHLNLSLKGSLLLMWISCSIALMHPSLFPFSVKMSWKAKTSSLAATAFLGVQLLRPPKFSFLRSFSCHAATIIGSCVISAPRAASISGDNSIGETREADTTCAILTPFSERLGCLTYSLLRWTPYCYSSSARYMGWKHVSLAEEAPPHLAELHKLSRALSSHEHFPLVLVLHSIIWVWNGPSFRFSFMKTGSSIYWSGEAMDAVAPSSAGALPPSPTSRAAVPCQHNKWEAHIITQEVDNWSSSLSLMTLTILPSMHVPITRGMHLENSDSSGTKRKTRSLSYLTNLTNLDSQDN